MKPKLRKPPIIIRGRKRMYIRPDGTEIPAGDPPEGFHLLCAPIQIDIDTAIPLSHTDCMYCRYWQRLGSKAVWVLRSEAWVEIPNEQGELMLARLIPSETARATATDFDASKKVKPHCVIFAAATGSRRLDVRDFRARHRERLKAARDNAQSQGKHPKDYDAERNSDQPKPAYAKGTVEGAKPKAKPKPKPKSRLADTRRDKATGMFQFRRK